MNKIIREKEIIKLKRELAYKYIYVMSIALIAFMMEFLYTEDYFMSYYLLAGLILLLIVFFSLKRYPFIKVVRMYMITMPFYNFVIICKFWLLSAASIVWVISIPFWAYIFFEKKEIIWFTAYAFLHILIPFFFAGTFAQYFENRVVIPSRYTDSFVYIFNLLLIFIGAYYKTKIRTLKVLSIIEEKEKITLPVTLDETFDPTGELFQKIEEKVTEKMLFKNSKLSLSLLSSSINVNNNYISKAIRNKGFNNFKHYINSHRISYVKTLIQENDLKKVNLMYIYTEAGFQNQSTFNKVFREIEGITPSEFIQSLKDTEE